MVPSTTDKLRHKLQVFSASQATESPVRAQTTSADGQERSAGAERQARSEGPSGQAEGAPARNIPSSAPAPESEADLEARRNAVIQRNLRFARRQRMAALLTSDARVQAGFPADQRTAEGWERPIKAGEEGWVRPPRPARCRWRSAEQVQIFGNSEGSASTHGTTQCASISACPVCSAIIRFKRASDIQTAVENWMTPAVTFAEEGAPVTPDRYALFMTLTTKHTRADPIEKGIDAVSNAWRDMTRGRWWLNFKKAHGIVGYVRSLEFTWTLKGGWHAHAHILFFCEAEKRPTDEFVKGAMSDEIFAHWVPLVVKNGGGKPAKKGFDLQLVRGDGTALAVYLSKVQEKPQRKAISSEMARADYKTGDGQTSWAPFDLLDDTGDVKKNAFFGGLFVEYWRQTQGRKILTWSSGLRALTLGTPELSDEEAAAAAAAAAEDEIPAPVVLLYTFQKSAYDAISNRPQLLADVYDFAAYGEVDAIAEIAVPYWVKSETRKAYEAQSEARISDFKAKYAEGQARRAAAELLNPPPIYDEAADF